MKTGVFIGRFQPFHEGHKQCITAILNENDRCIVCIRDTDQSDSNPLSYNERATLIRAAFPDTQRIAILPLPDPGSELSVYIGRDVGYRLIRLDPDTEAIRATDLRAQLYQS